MSRAAVAGGDAAWGIDDDPAIGEIALELAAGAGGCGIVAGEGGAGAGLLEEAAGPRIVGAMFLDKPSDFATVEEFGEMQQQ